MVVSIDSFWRVQVNFHSGIWPTTGGKRKWKDLWEIALSNILKTCKDIGALTACEIHLRESIRLREMKVEEYSRNEGQGGEKRKMTEEEKNQILALLDVVDQALDSANEATNSQELTAAVMGAAGGVMGAAMAGGQDGGGGLGGVVGGGDVGCGGADGGGGGSRGRR